MALSGNISAIFNSEKGISSGIPGSGSTPHQNLLQRLYNNFIGSIGNEKTLNRVIFNGNSVILPDDTVDIYNDQARLSDWVGALGLSGYIFMNGLLSTDSELSKLIHKTPGEKKIFTDIFSFIDIVKTIYESKKDQGEEVFFSARLENKTLEAVLGMKGEYKPLVNKLLSHYIISESIDDLAKNQKPRYLAILKEVSASVLGLKGINEKLSDDVRAKEKNTPYVALLEENIGVLKQYLDAKKGTDEYNDFIAMLNYKLPPVVPLESQAIEAPSTEFMTQRRNARVDFYAKLVLYGVTAMTNMHAIKTRTKSPPNLYTQAVDNLLGLYTSMIPEQFQKKEEQK